MSSGTIEKDVKEVPIVFKDGTRVGPVTLICATVLLLAAIAGFIYLVQLNPANEARYLDALVPLLTNLATALFIWVRIHQTNAQVQNTQAQVQDTKDAVESAQTSIASKLNGELDARMENTAESMIKKLYTQLTGQAWPDKPLEPETVSIPTPVETAPTIPSQETNNG